MSATIPGAPGGGESGLVWNPLTSTWETLAVGSLSTAGNSVAYFGNPGGTNVTLSPNNDFADGRGGADTIDGGAGNDVIVGGAGSDSLIGGDGADTLIGGQATVTGALDGGPLNITFAAHTGALSGDVDTLVGGAGNDTYIVRNGLEVIVEAEGGGSDTVLVAGPLPRGEVAYTLTAPHVEALGLLNPTTTTGYSLAVADSLTGGVSISGGAGDDTLTGGGGNDTITGLAGNNQLNGGAGNDLFVIAGGDNTVAGGAGQDTVTFSSAGNVTITGASGGNFTIVGADGTAFTSGVEFLGGRSGPIALDDSLVGQAIFVCFAAGTRILTAKGEVPVERLQAGDLVATLAGNGAPMKPVLWVGHRRVVLAGNPHAEELAPIRIRAGALGDNVPHRDLVVSPDHCMFLDGALVPARLLVNGSSITVERGMAEVTWYHIELERHDILLAEGAAAESWLDCGNRAWFENAKVAMLGVSGNLDSVGSGWDSSRACAPMLHGGPQLAAVRAAIAGQAARPGPRQDPARLSAIA